MDNLEFLRRHAAPGRVGLVGGNSFVERAIRRAQRPLVAGGADSRWGHAFVFQGERADGQDWVIESDLDFERARWRAGVQENRIAKYGDAGTYRNLAVLDFGLSSAESQRVVAAGLDLVSAGARYAVGGAMKTWLALLRGGLGREREKRSMFCSALVRVLFGGIGRDLVPGVAVRHTTPEHLWQAPADGRWELIRP